MRTLRPSLFVAAGFAAGGLAAVAPACSVDSGPAPTYDAAPPPDATPPADAAPPPVDATPVCDDVELNVVETGHHAERYDYTDGGGQGCMGWCHNATEDSFGGPVFTAAGALYDRRTGDGQGGPAGDPVAGAYIYVIDANGKVVRMMTALNGFFWTNEELATPIRTYASGCPDSIPMVANTTGNCNVAACHGEENKIYLPNAGAL